MYSSRSTLTGTLRVQCPHQEGDRTQDNEPDHRATRSRQVELHFHLFKKKMTALGLVGSAKNVFAATFILAKYLIFK